MNTNKPFIHIRNIHEYVVYRNQVYGERTGKIHNGTIL
jgi:hypothetical protein